MLLPDHVIASVLDPGNNGFDIGDLLDITLVIAAIYGAVRAIASGVRWLDAKRGEAHRLDVLAIMAPVLAQQTDDLLVALTKATLPIQPTTNGGKSLPDVHVTLERVEEAIAYVIHSVRRVEGRIEVVEEQQLLAHKEREKILSVADANAHAVVTAVTTLGGEIGGYKPFAEYLNGPPDPVTFEPDESI